MRERKDLLRLRDFDKDRIETRIEADDGRTIALARRLRSVPARREQERTRGHRRMPKSFAGKDRLERHDPAPSDRPAHARPQAAIATH